MDGQWAVQGQQGSKGEIEKNLPSMEIAQFIFGELKDMSKASMYQHAEDMQKLCNQIEKIIEVMDKMVHTWERIIETKGNAKDEDDEVIPNSQESKESKKDDETKPPETRKRLRKGKQ